MNAADRFVLGTWGLSGAGTAPSASAYGPVSAHSAAETFDRAWEMGLRIVDTAPAYGGGEGLRRLAHWQRSRGLNWQVAAKPGRPRVDGRPVSRIDPAALLEEITAGADLVGSPAFVLIKDPDPESYQDGRLAQALDALEWHLPQTTVGVASHLPEALAGLSCGTNARVAQIELNAVNRHVSVPAARRLAKSGWEVWAMQPLAYGFLARPDRRPQSEDDWRGQIPEHVQAGLCLAARTFAEAVGADAGLEERAAAAIAFCLSVPAVSRVVIGPKGPKQLEAAEAALTLVDDATTLSRLHAWTP
ncbi:aldo/keto reductase [Kitasatospora sp. NPDC001547]|uniref:aldo/keto reductase n=1 Tax=Kitasatospora sp. NPDC001547 TaxID=3364015 RepID=UPI0036998ABA|nr:hypothetical protein KitaXyl93_42660 [Kitasatospora sp. Xyl93]